MATTYERPTGPVQTASGLNILAGLWLVLSPWALNYSIVEAAMWNSVIIGLAVAIMAMVRVGAPLRYEGLSWLNFVLGIWLILAPFMLGFAAIGAAMWNTVIVGLIVLILAAWSAVATRNITQTATPEPRDRPRA
jgi:hypothetical protein